MLCNGCGKNPAQLYLKRTGDKEIRLHLCPECYQRLYGDKTADDFFTSFLNSAGGRQKACPACGSTLEDFRRTGLLGCATCYSAFREELMPTVRHIQGRVTHEGRAPSADAYEDYDVVRGLVHEQQRLEERIEEAKRAGNRAETAQLREQLRAINRKLYRGGDRE